MSLNMYTDLHWRDRKRYWGLPLSFDVYAITEDRLILSSGLLLQTERSIMLYRVRDISLSRSFTQRLFGVGTVTVMTSDNEVVTLENISAPRQVKELLHQNIEDQKRARHFRFGEYDFGDREFFPWFPGWM